MTLSDSTLALATALLAVAGVAVPLLYRLVFPVDLLYAGLSETGREILVSAINREPVPVHIRNITLAGSCLKADRLTLRLFDPELGPRGPQGRPGGWEPQSEYFLPSGASLLYLRAEDTPSLTGLPCDDLQLSVKLGSGRQTSTGNLDAAEIEQALRATRPDSPKAER